MAGLSFSRLILISALAATALAPLALAAPGAGVCVDVPSAPRERATPLCIDTSALAGTPAGDALAGVKGCAERSGASLQACGQRMMKEACGQGDLIEKVTSVALCAGAGALTACFETDDFHSGKFTDCVERAGSGLCPRFAANKETRQASGILGVNASALRCPFSARGTSACLEVGARNASRDACIAPSLPEVRASGATGDAPQAWMRIGSRAMTTLASGARTAFATFSSAILWLKAHLGDGSAAR